MLKLTLKHEHLAFFHQAVYPRQLWFGLLLNPVVALEQTTNSSKPQPDTPGKGPQTCPLHSPASLHPSQCPSAQRRELGMQKKTPDYPVCGDAFFLGSAETVTGVSL